MTAGPSRRLTIAFAQDGASLSRLRRTRTAISETALYETRHLPDSRAGVFGVRNPCPKSMSHSYAGPWVSRLLGCADRRDHACTESDAERKSASQQSLKRRAQPLFERVETRRAGDGSAASGLPAPVG